MPIDASIYSRSDYRLPERIASILDPTNIQERKNKLADLNTQRQTNALQLKNLQRESARAPILEGRQDEVYSQAQAKAKQDKIMGHVNMANQMILSAGATDDSIKQGTQYLIQNGIPPEMAAKGFEPMLGMDIPSRQQMLGKQLMAPEKLGERTVPELPKPKESVIVPKDAQLIDPVTGRLIASGLQSNSMGGEKPAPNLLQKDQRWVQKNGEWIAEVIPGTKSWLAQKDKFSADKSTVDTLDNMTKTANDKIAYILDEKNKDAFNNLFGGYNAKYITQYASGKTASVKQKLESLKSEMKISGLNIMRAGGGIGQMTEREWPIVEKMIDSLDATMDEANARDVITEIGRRMNGLAKIGRDKFTTEWSGGQFDTGQQNNQPPSGGNPAQPTQPKRIKFDAQGNMVQ